MNSCGSKLVGWTVLMAAWAVSACGTLELTGIDLRIHSEEAGEMEWMEVAVYDSGGEMMHSPERRPEGGRPVKSTETVLILLPGELDGELVLVHVMGFYGQHVVAEGAVEVVVEAGVLQEAEVELNLLGYCETDEDCAKGEVCLPEGWCASGCMVEDVFAEPGEPSPDNECLICKPDVSTREWVPSDAGTSCGDGKVCDGAGKCVMDDPGRVAVLVEVGGLGGGKVHSEPGVIDCGSVCSALVEIGSTLSLTAVPDEESMFSEWRGDACVESESTCTLTVEEQVVVTARFDVKVHELEVSLAGTGSGNVVSTDGVIDCGGGDCSALYEHGETVTLVKSVQPGSEFVGWEGACEGSEDTCELSITEDTQVIAEFDLHRHELTVDVFGGGEGHVQSDDGAIDCHAAGGSCRATYGHGDEVVLTRSVAEGSVFAGWGEACDSSSETCKLTMTGALEVTAEIVMEVFELAVTVVGTGSGTVESSDGAILCGGGDSDCVAEYEFGQEVSLTRESGSGSRFAGWGGACAGSDRSCDFVMNDDLVVFATFELRTYELDVSWTGDGDGTVRSADGAIECGVEGSDCSAIYSHGQTVVLTPESVSSSHFEGWGGSCQGDASTCELTMTANRSASARFQLNSYTLSVTVTGSGEGTVTSTGGTIECGSGGTKCDAAYLHGQMVNLTATWGTYSELTAWGGACAHAEESSCLLEVTGTTEVVAEINLITHEIQVDTLGNGAGTITTADQDIDCGDGKESCEASYEHGSMVTLHAEASEGSTFVGWSGDCAHAGMDEECALEVTESRDAAAEFTLNSYVLTVETRGDGEGTVSSTPEGIDCGNKCEATYLYGQVVSLQQSYSGHNEFIGWGGDCSGDDDTCELLISGDHLVTARFEPRRYMLSVSTVGNGEGTVMTDDGVIDCGHESWSCSVLITYGETVVLNQSAEPSSYFSSWYGDCASAGVSCLVQMEGHRSVDADFSLKSYPLEVSKEGSGGGTVISEPGDILCGLSCEDEFDHYTEVTLSATPDEHSAFVGWSGAGCSGTGSCIVPMTQARSVIARFGRKGRVLREYWLGISGTAVSDLTNHSNFPDNPSGATFPTIFEGPTNWTNHYGTRMRGYIHAPYTGDYVFWIASDDNSELWLSTDPNPANKVLIAYVPVWTNPREWNKFSSQQSQPIHLRAGQTYYIEALHKEHEGGDNIAVAWQPPGESRQVIPGAFLSQY